MSIFKPRDHRGIPVSAILLTYAIRSASETHMKSSCRFRRAIVRMRFRDECHVSHSNFCRPFPSLPCHSPKARKPECFYDVIPVWGCFVQFEQMFWRWQKL
ncbi:hypothetical protein AVEN_109354-1 [Araneus ventricosus]|uniref:Uncharacterized protein n=1 Tax=Araneus ventricosus TaxID=182803 RepID=A0A4Y2GLU7_ARAVE|nr:hypothetical protein AVEN_109354-1 [Araneus ventricosus]